MNFSPALLRFATLKTSELTPQIVGEIAKSFGFSPNVSDEGFQKILGLLKEDDVDGVADLIGKPSTFMKVKEFLSPAGDDNLIVCPHCGEYMQPH